MMRNFFAVLGGMGTLATESYIRLVDKATQAHQDQEFLDYVVFNNASVPDRTQFILGESNEDPFPYIADDVLKATEIGASFITLPCNTAHHFFDRLQALTPVPILHMPNEALAEMIRRYPVESHPRVGFMGTEGSLNSGIYRKGVEAAGYAFEEPDAALQKDISYLIYHDVKDTGVLERDRYEAVLDTMLKQRHCDVVILGCTELSVFNEAFPMPELPIIDAQEILAVNTVARAQLLRSQQAQERSIF
ncbi:aspartate/glutamate racemase family protein [Bifidobacterium crudilactis]|uniref:aspartate/glutamate racemase family protein n=1 Tax=Bifidobacterium crudilactis TaxID=327277 RepID=UPI002353425F|nr:amino acid racemase [Bifidobacterium crudilactis]MCI1637950.1 amino acid racemase [Bifidobacterium crudilactis]MCI1643377.1 amino acid racemase [Bifidobacterium crudilactis]MCI1889556.1 amino acid racemase [Bifidobacterium crudilactis]